MASNRPARPIIHVEVFSDVACPWCWIGWNRLNQAVDEFMVHGAAAFDVRWRAFLLDPNFAEGGEAIENYYQRRYGDQAPALRRRLHDSGKWDGAPFADWRWRPDTRGAHELAALAGQAGKSHEAAGLLFRQTYEEGVNLSDRQALMSAASTLGLPRGEAEAWLGSPRHGSMWRKTMMRPSAGKRRSIHSVPTFTISCGHSKPVQLVGAESVKAFEVVFRKVLHEGAAGTAGVPGSPKKAATAQQGATQAKQQAAAEE